MAALIRMIAIAAVAMAAFGCRDTTEGPVPARRVDFCTLLSTEPLSFQVSEAGRQATLCARDQRITDDLTPGIRMVIEYLTFDYSLQGSDIDIDLKAWAVPLQGEIEALGPEAIRQLPPAQAEVQGAARDGDFINIQLMALYSGSSRTLSAAADASTLDAPTVRIWLYNPGKPVDTPASINRKYYASFSLATLGLSPEQQVEVVPITEKTSSK